MARVEIMPSLCPQFFDGTEPLSIEAGNVFQLIAALDRLRPGFAAFAEGRVAFGVDGAVVNDWSTPLGQESEVLLVPRIAGG